MKLSRTVQGILDNYAGENPGCKANLARLLMNGRTGGSGRMIILPVDQGFEHGPARSFASNPEAYDPAYHPKLALAAGLSAYAAPLGSLEAVADLYAAQVPLILKLNSANSLSRLKEDASQAITASVSDALRLGCAAVGYTIYPGSDACYDMMNDLRDIIAEAKQVGLAVVVWSYPRGGTVSKTGETAMDVVAYGAHIACLLGAHIIKVKLPTEVLEQDAAKKVFTEKAIPVATLTDRVREVVRSCFNGKRLVVFSGGEAKDTAGLMNEATAIRDGGGNGSIIGRNAFQRPHAEALAMFNDMTAIYNAKAA